MTTGIVDLDLLQFDPNPLESRGQYTRYEIDENDQYEFSLDTTEWFCTICGELITDIDEPECDCNTD